MTFRAIIPDEPENDKKNDVYFFLLFFVLPTTRHDDTGYIVPAPFY